MQNLLFIMTPGVGLSMWEANGTCPREMRPYVEHSKKGMRVRIISFDKEGAGMFNSLGTIEIVTAKVGFISAHLLPFTHARHFKWATVVKTNQSYMSWIFAFAAKLYRKPLYLRCGYVRGEYLEAVNGYSIPTKTYQFFEGWAFRTASAVSVPTKELAAWVADRYSVPIEGISVLPNWVDTEVFSPNTGAETFPNSIISIGRLHADKRYDLLIKSCVLIPNCRLTIVGEGPEKNNLISLAKSLAVDLSLPGIISHEALPVLLRKHKVFALTSKREGHPKSAIEALSCGVPCVSVAAAGLQNLFVNERTAIISEPTPEGIAASIKRVLTEEALARQLSDNGRKEAVERYSIDSVFNLESSIVRRLSSSC